MIWSASVLVRSSQLMGLPWNVPRQKPYLFGTGFDRSDSKFACGRAQGVRLLLFRYRRCLDYESTQVTRYFVARQIEDVRHPCPHRTFDIHLQRCRVLPTCARRGTEGLDVSGDGGNSIIVSQALKVFYSIETCLDRGIRHTMSTQLWITSPDGILGILQCGLTFVCR